MEGISRKNRRKYPERFFLCSIIFTMRTLFILLLTLCSAARAGEKAPLNSSAPLSPLQHLRIEQITTIFENSTPDFQYAFIEDIEDGAGITSGRVGFNSYHGSLLTLVEAYTKASPANKLAPFIPCLKELRGRGNYECLFPSVPAQVLATKEFKTKGLMETDFGLAFEKAAADPVFRKVQDDFVEENIFLPALETAEKLHIRTALGIAMIYDTGVQTGYGLPMGVEGIISRMKSHPKKEAAWLAAYMASRLDTLQHPFRDDGTRFEKPEYNTVPRAEALIEILKAKNFTLTKPVKFHYFGDAFELK